MREYTVFNVHQCDGLPDSIRAGKPMRVRNPDTRDVRTVTVMVTILFAVVSILVFRFRGRAVQLPSR